MENSLIFPLEELNDQQRIQKFSFESVREEVYERLAVILSNESLETADQTERYTCLSNAFLKAICYANQVNQSGGENKVNHRIMVI